MHVPSNPSLSESNLAMRSEPDTEHPRKRIRLDQDVSANPGDLTATAYSTSAQADQESKCGITEYATKGTQFTCTVKQRYTDFLVNEIQPSGHVVHLDSSALCDHESSPQKTATENAKHPVEPKQPAVDGCKENEKTSQDTTSDTNTLGNGNPDKPERSISPSETARVEAIFGATITAALCTLYAKIKSKPGAKARDFGKLQSDVISDKQQRTEAHIVVRHVFSGILETITDSDNRITIKASGLKSASRDPGAQRSRGQHTNGRGKVSWSELGGDYLHFTLYKENKDTMEVLGFLAAKLRLNSRNFQMAGTKDRRGVTVQRISAYRTLAERFQGLNKSLRQARIGGYQYRQHGLSMGELAGNEFRLTLRDCHVADDAKLTLDERFSQLDDILRHSVSSLNSRGFINYYGLQRFGSFAIGTHDVGRLMIQGNLKAAVSSILAVSPATHEEMKNPTESSRLPLDDRLRAEAIDEWLATQKLSSIIDKLPRRFQAENAVIRYLGSVQPKTGEKPSEDWQGALMAIPRNLRLMYVHAYQSLVWNRAAAKRIGTCGHVVIEGDLVIVDKTTNVAVARPGEEVDDEGEIIVRPAADDSANTAADDHERARALTKEEADSGKFSIFDIVLPLPGYDVEYPRNAIGDFYKEYMAQDNLDPHNMRRPWRDASLTGGYRKLMSRPMQISYELQTYGRDDEQLVKTDLEKLLDNARAAVDAVKTDLEKLLDNARAAVDAVKTDQVKMESAGHDKIAVVLKMQLGSSQYATMTLRELTKGGAFGFKPDFQGDR